VPGSWKSLAGKGLAVILGVVTAMSLRTLMTPWLSIDAAPFITAFPAVAVVAFFAGVGTGAMAAIACAVWVALPGFAPAIEGLDGWRELAVYLPSAFLVAFFAGQASQTQLMAEAKVADEGRPGLIRWLRWSMVLAAALPTLFFCVAAWSTYRDAVHDAETRVDRAARVGVEQASKVLETNETIARHVLSTLNNETLAEAQAREGKLHELLRSAVEDIPQIQSVWIIGRDGRAVATDRFFPVPKGVDFSDREGLRVYLAGAHGAHVTVPQVGRITGEPFFDLSAPWYGPDGTLQGAVWVSLHPTYCSAPTVPSWRVARLPRPGTRTCRLRAGS
jgi:hypothetical protein